MRSLHLDTDSPFNEQTPAVAFVVEEKNMLRVTCCPAACNVDPYLQHVRKLSPSVQPVDASRRRGRRLG